MSVLKGDILLSTATAGVLVLLGVFRAMLVQCYLPLSSRSAVVSNLLEVLLVQLYWNN